MQGGRGIFLEPYALQLLPFTLTLRLGCGGRGRYFYALQLLSFTLTHHFGCAEIGVRGCTSSFFASWQRTKQENTPRATPLDPAPPQAAHASRFGASLRYARRGLEVLLGGNASSCSAPPPRRVGLEVRCFAWANSPLA